MSETSKPRSPGRLAAALVVGAAAIALGFWAWPRPEQAAEVEQIAKPEPEPARVVPPPAAAGGREARAVDVLERAEASTRPSASEPETAPPVRKISPSLRLPYAKPSGEGAASGLRASQAACAAWLARTQRGEALDAAEQRSWDRLCRSREAPASPKSLRYPGTR